MTDSWTNQKTFVVDEKMLSYNWAGRGRVAFGCGFCLRRFELGDRGRWIFGDGVINTFVCELDDSPDVQKRWKKRWLTEIKPILDRWG